MTSHFRLTAIVALAFIFCFSANLAYSDDGGNSPSIIGGKIWGGSDTLNVGVKAKSPEAEIDWSSGDIIELANRTVSSKTRKLILNLSTSGDLKLIPDAPIKLAANSSDTTIIKIEESLSTNPEKPLAFPITVSTDSGEADIYLYYKVIACESGPRNICFYKEGKLKVPVTIGENDESTLEISHEIEN